jgi:hypothetical protein
MYDGENAIHSDRERRPPVSHRSADALDDTAFVEDLDKRKPLTYQDGLLATDILESIHSAEIAREGSPDADRGAERKSEIENESSEFDEEGREMAETLLGSRLFTMSRLHPVHLHSNEHSKGTTAKFGSSTASPLATFSGRISDNLPYTFEAPSSLEELCDLMKGRSFDDQLLIIDRVLVCTHIKVAPTNGHKLELFFDALMNYVKTLTEREESRDDSFGPVPLFHLNFIGRLASPVFQLAEQIPKHVASYFLNFLKEHQLHLSKKHTRHFPDLHSLIIFKFIISIYPVSDFQHAIISPCILLVSQYLEQCSLRSLHDATSGLILCSILFKVTFLLWKRMRENFPVL